MKTLATRFFLGSLVCVYFFAPMLVRGALGADFYVYSSAQDGSSYISVFFGCLLLVLVFSTTYFPGRKNSFEFPIYFFKLNYFVSIIYCVGLAAYGLYLRLGGLSRIELLQAQTSFMLPGVGFFLLFGGLFLILERGWRYFFAFAIAALAVDYFFMGKIYAFILASIAVVKWDVEGRRFGFFQSILLVFGSAGFLLLTYYLRAVSAAEGEVGFFVDSYSLFSEFVGVQASVGWAVEYINVGRLANLSDFSSPLRDYYVGFVGHGLALSPAAYFYANFGSLWILASIVFALSIYTLINILGFYFGPAIVFLLAYNFQHLMRHGPDIFLMKILGQMLALALVCICLPLLQSKKPRGV